MGTELARLIEPHRREKISGYVSRPDLSDEDEKGIQQKSVTPIL